MNRILNITALTLATLCLNATVHAGAIAYYGLGEADPGAVAGNVANASTVDSAGGANLNRFGTPSYSSATAAPGSSLAMLFNGTTDYFMGPVVTTSINHIAMEAWANPGSTANSVIALNGNNYVSGYGLIIDGGHYNVLFGSVNVYDAGLAIQGMWTHLGFQVDDGLIKVYRDGKLFGSYGGSPNPIPHPLLPAEPYRMSIGSGAYGAFLFNGLIDGVKVSNTPEPASWALVAIGAALAACRRVRR